MRDVCKIEVDCPDGVVYEPNSVIMEVMQNQREYEGVRVRFHARLESAKIPMQIDLGFGDVVTPAPEQIAYPTLLDLPAPILRGYPVETVIAEKLHTMVEKGMLNSRVKDYHDVWMLLRWGCFDAEVLERALVRTFEQRETRLDRMQLFQIIERYGATAERQLHWERYRRKGAYETAPQNLAQVCSDIISALKDQWREPPISGDLDSIGWVLGRRKSRGRDLLKVVQRLIDSGADVNDERNNGHRPLNIAVNHGLREVALLLLEAGANFQMKDRSGLSAFEWALTRGLYDVAHEMVNRGHPYTPRHPNRHLKAPYQNLYQFDLRYY